MFDKHRFFMLHGVQFFLPCVFAIMMITGCNSFIPEYPPALTVSQKQHYQSRWESLSQSDWIDPESINIAIAGIRPTRGGVYIDLFFASKNEESIRKTLGKVGLVLQESNYYRISGHGANMRLGVPSRPLFIIHGDLFADPPYELMGEISNFFVGVQTVSMSAPRSSELSADYTIELTDKLVSFISDRGLKWRVDPKYLIIKITQ